MPEISKLSSMILPIRDAEIKMLSDRFSNALLIPPVTFGSFSNSVVII